MSPADADLLVELNRLAAAGRYGDAARVRRELHQATGVYLVHRGGLGMVEHRDSLPEGTIPLTEFLVSSEERLEERIRRAEWGEVADATLSSVETNGAVQPPNPEMARASRGVASSQGPLGLARFAADQPTRHPAAEGTRFDESSPQ